MIRAPPPQEGLKGVFFCALRAIQGIILEVVSTKQIDLTDNNFQVIDFREMV